MKTGSSRQPVWHVAADNDITLVQPVYTRPHSVLARQKTIRASVKAPRDKIYMYYCYPYEWQPSLFDNDNLSPSSLTFETRAKNCKIPFPKLKTAEQKPVVVSGRNIWPLCKSEWMLFLIDLSSSAIPDTNPDGHYNVIQHVARSLVFHFSQSKLLS